MLRSRHASAPSSKFWEVQLQAAALLGVLEGLRAGVDIGGIIDNKDDDEGDWKKKSMR